MFMFTLLSSRIDVYHIYSGELVTSYPAPDGESMVSYLISDNGQQLFIGTSANKLYSLNLTASNATWNFLSEFETGFEPVYLRPSGVPIIIASGGMNISVFNVSEGIEMERNGNFGPSRQPGYAKVADQNSVFNINYGLSGHITLYRTELKPSKVLNRIDIFSSASFTSSEYFSNTRGLAAKPDGSSVYTVSGGSDGVSHLIVDGREITFESQFYIGRYEDIVLDQNGFIFVNYTGSSHSSGNPGTVIVLDETGSRIDAIGLEDENEIVAGRSSFTLSGDNKRLAILYSTGTENGVYITASNSNL